MRKATVIALVAFAVVALAIAVLALTNVVSRARLAIAGIAFTPKSFAQRIEMDDAAIVELFCRAGQSANANIRGTTPLMLAVSKGRLRAAQALLEPRCRADVNSVATVPGMPSLRWPPIMEAASLDDIAQVRLLLLHGANPRSKDANGRNALTEALAGEHAADLLDELFRAGATPADAQAAFDRAVQWGGRQGRAAVLDRLVRGGARAGIADDLARIDPGGGLSGADVARWLIAHGADVRSSEGLAVAARRGDVELVRLILDSGANANRASSLGSFTPLHWVVWNSDRAEQRAEVVRLLMTAGADLNARLTNVPEPQRLARMALLPPLEGSTPLILCAKVGCDPKIAEPIIHAGDDLARRRDTLNARDAAGFDALHYAKGELAFSIAYMPVDVRAISEPAPRHFSLGDSVCVNFPGDPGAAYCGVADGQSDDRIKVRITSIDMNCGWHFRCGIDAGRCTGNRRIMKVGAGEGDAVVGDYVWIPGDCVQ